MTDHRTPAQRGRDILEADWLIPWDDDGDTLHHATLTDDQAAMLGEDCEATAVTFTCGTGPIPVAVIPGFGVRLTADRCPACCAATGLPQGVGSPKNDDACRRVLGYPVHDHPDTVTLPRGECEACDIIHDARERWATQ